MTKSQPNQGAAMLELANGLTDLERELLMGEAHGWGSWMFEVGADLCAKGLGRKHNGSIYFDTPLANELREYLASAKAARQRASESRTSLPRDAVQARRRKQRSRDSAGRNGIAHTFQPFYL